MTQSCRTKQNKNSDVKLRSLTPGQSVQTVAELSSWICTTRCTHGVTTQAISQVFVVDRDHSRSVRLSTVIRYRYVLKVQMIDMPPSSWGEGVVRSHVEDQTLELEEEEAGE